MKIYYLWMLHYAFLKKAIKRSYVHNYKYISRMNLIACLHVFFIILFILVSLANSNLLTQMLHSHLPLSSIGAVLILPLLFFTWQLRKGPLTTIKRNLLKKILLKIKNIPRIYALIYALIGPIAYIAMFITLIINAPPRKKHKRIRKNDSIEVPINNIKQFNSKAISIQFPLTIDGHKKV